MGIRYKFRCVSCGYEAMVSGGDDFGIRAFTTTILCKGCKELYDVVTAEMPPSPDEEGFRPSEPACPEYEDHPVRRWQKPGLCPRCNHQMVPGEEWLLWD